MKNINKALIVTTLILSAPAMAKSTQTNLQWSEALTESGKQEFITHMAANCESAGGLAYRVAKTEEGTSIIFDVYCRNFKKADTNNVEQILKGYSKN